MSWSDRGKTIFDIYFGPIYNRHAFYKKSFRWERFIWLITYSVLMKASLLIILLTVAHSPLAIAKSGYSQASENITA
jgi:hypothetical protein